MATTAEWAKSLGISTESTVPIIEDYTEPCARSVRDIAVRSLLLQGLIAIAEGVESEPIVDWFKEQNILNDLTPKEHAFIKNKEAGQNIKNHFSWLQEAQWALLWTIGKFEVLDLPTKYCNSALIVDEIMPGLGDDIQTFIAESNLRSPGELLAEDDRTYNLWCYAVKAKQNNTLPSDLNYNVLFYRRYAFEWLDGIQDWDDVTCDA